MLSGEATNSNFIVFGFTWSGLKLTIYRTRSDAVKQEEYKNIVIMYNTFQQKLMIMFILLLSECFQSGREVRFGRRRLKEKVSLLFWRFLWSCLWNTLSLSNLIPKYWFMCHSENNLVFILPVHVRKPFKIIIRKYLSLPGQLSYCHQFVSIIIIVLH